MHGSPHNPVPAAPGPECSILDASRSLEPRAVEWIRSRALAAAGFLGCLGELRVRIVDDAEMSELHAKYSGIEGTTDVLTFDLSHGESARNRVLDVDIAACADEARRRASERAHAPERELLLYVVHGMLHCLGHDDHTDEGFARMHALEDETLGAIGVGATFAEHGSVEGRPA